MLVLRQVVVVLVHTLYDGIEILHAIILNDSLLGVLIVNCILLSLALNIVIESVLFQRPHEALSGLIERDFFVLFVDQWR